MSVAYKNTILTAYPAGCYGSFLDWCINWFSGHIPEHIVPFTETGSAHYWSGHTLGDVKGDPQRNLSWFLNTSEEPLSIRTHLNYDNICNQTQHINLISQHGDNFRKIILINHNVGCHLLVLHNVLTKVRNKSYEQLTIKVVQRFKQQFNAEEPIPVWQLREMISFYHQDVYCEMRDTYQPVVHHNVVNVGIKQLVYDFESTLSWLFDQLELPMSRKSQLSVIKDQWLSQQCFIHRDKHCIDFVDAVLTGKNYEFESPNHFIDEAFVQWKLRNQGFEIRCDGLDKFPTNSLQLKKLLYPV